MENIGLINIGAPRTRNVIITPEVQYNTYAATSGTTSISSILPAEGEKDIIYRIGNWDGAQVSANYYAEYAWDGTQYVLLAVRDGVDDAALTFEGDAAGQYSWIGDVNISAGSVVSNIGDIDVNLYSVKDYDAPVRARSTTGSMIQIPEGADIVAVRAAGTIGHCSLVIYKDPTIFNIPQNTADIATNTENISTNAENIAQNTADILTKVDIKLGKNLLNVDDPNRMVGKAISTDGVVFEDEPYTDICCVSDYIPVEAETDYHLSSKTGGLCFNYGLCYYTSDKTFISGDALKPRDPEDPTKFLPDVLSITTPASCAYIRTSYAFTREELMINKGAEAVPYEPYSVIGGYMQDVQEKDYTNELEFLAYPARTDGDQSTAGWFAGYSIPLRGLYEEGYRLIKFRASTYLSTSAITAGMIYSEKEEPNQDYDPNDEESTETIIVREIESTTKSGETNWECDWFTLPITEYSVELVATYGKKGYESQHNHPEIIFTPKVAYFGMESIEDAFPYTVLPSKIYGVIGDTLQLFNRSIVAAIDPYQWYHNFTCNAANKIAKAYNRYFEITPQKVESGGGSVVPTGLTIKHKLTNANLKSSDENVSQFIIADAPTPADSPSSNINVLCIGASTTEGGQWPSELKRKLVVGDNWAELSTHDKVTISKGEIYEINNIQVTIEDDATDSWSIVVSSDDIDSIPSSGTLVNTSDPEDTIWYTSIKGLIQEGDGLTNITFVGAKKGNSPDCAMPVKVEATGGWRWRTFYTPGEDKPFPATYDVEGHMTALPDFSTYADNHCDGEIDVVIFNMGNQNEQIWSEGDLNSSIENMKTLIDGLHEDFQDCKVIIGTGSGFSPYNGTEYYYGAGDPNFRTPTMIYWNRRYLKAVDDAVKAYNAAAGSDWCFLANTMIECDSEHIFKVEQKAVNVRLPDVEETVGIDGVHPELVGYQMLADSFYRCFVNVVLN